MIWRQHTPLKINGWNLKITSFLEGNHLKYPPPWLWVQTFAMIWMQDMTFPTWNPVAIETKSRLPSPTLRRSHRWCLSKHRWLRRSKTEWKGGGSFEGLGWGASFPKFPETLGVNLLHHFWKQPGDEMAISFRILLLHIDLMHFVHVFLISRLIASGGPVWSTRPQPYIHSFLFVVCAILPMFCFDVWMKNSFFFRQTLRHSKNLEK